MTAKASKEKSQRGTERESERARKRGKEKQTGGNRDVVGTCECDPLGRFGAEAARQITIQF